MLKDFLLQPSLGLLVRTYPELEAGLELLESPPHRVDGPVDLGESPLAFLTSNPGTLCPGLGARLSFVQPRPGMYTILYRFLWTCSYRWLERGNWGKGWRGGREGGREADY